MWLISTGFIDISLRIPILSDMAKYRDRRLRRVSRGALLERTSERARRADLMLDALGLPVRRAMLVRLRTGGTMSMSKLSIPFGLTLPGASKHVNVLEEAGIIITEKQGRVRLCIYNPHAFKELAGFLASHAAFWEQSFGRLERHLSTRVGISKGKKK